MCVMNFGGSWDDHLPLVEFAYNDSYIAVLKRHHIKLSMQESVDPLCVGMRLGKES